MNRQPIGFHRRPGDVLYRPNGDRIVRPDPRGWQRRLKRIQQQPRMAITVLNAGAHSGSQTGGSNSFNYTVSTGTNTILLVAVGVADNSSRTVSGITWNTSQSLTQVPSARRNDATKGWVDWWYLLSPTAATAQPIATTFSTAPDFNYVIGAVVFAGVDQSTVFDATAVTQTDNGITNPGAPIVTVTDGAAAVGNLFVNNAPAITPNVTQIYTAIIGGSLDAYATEYMIKTPAGSANVDWTLDAASDCLVSIIALMPAAGGGGGGNIVLMGEGLT